MVAPIGLVYMNMATDRSHLLFLRLQAQRVQAVQLSLLRLLFRTVGSIRAAGSMVLMAGLCKNSKPMTASLPSRLALENVLVLAIQLLAWNTASNVSATLYSGMDPPRLPSPIVPWDALAIRQRNAAPVTG